MSVRRGIIRMLVGVVVSSMAAFLLVPGVYAALPADCSSLTGYVVPESECNVLVELYNATDGDNWSDNTDWGSGDACDWYGVDCTTVGTGSYVNRIALGYNNLSGTLPSASLIGLPYMENFNVEQNTLDGQILAAWTGWTNLVYLNLANNNMTGALPPEWGEAWSGTIYSLRLGNNSLTGTLPDEWSVWQVIDDIELTSVGVSGTLPTSWASLTTLRGLSLRRNNLTGTLPDSWSARTSMYSFVIDGNNLSGSLPVSWSSWTGIYYFYVYNNGDIGGYLPIEYSAWSSLRAIGIGGDPGNLASFDALPTAWGDAWKTTLISFYMYYTDFATEIPAEYALWSGLSDVRISNNYLYGSTDFLSGLSLSILYLDNNCYDPATVGVGISATSKTVLPQQDCHDFGIAKSTTYTGVYGIGEQISYQIDWYTTGLTNTTGDLEIRDYADPSFSIVSSTQAYTTGTDGSGEYISWMIPGIPVGSTGSLVYTADVVPISTGFSSGANYAVALASSSDYPDLGADNFSETIYVNTAKGVYLIMYMNDNGPLSGSDSTHSYSIQFINAGDYVNDGIVTLEGDISIANITLSGSTPPISDFVNGSYIQWTGVEMPGYLSGTPSLQYDLLIDFPVDGTYVLTASVASASAYNYNPGSPPIFSVTTVIATSSTGSISRANGKKSSILDKVFTEKPLPENAQEIAKEKDPYEKPPGLVTYEEKMSDREFIRAYIDNRLGDDLSGSSRKRILTRIKEKLDFYLLVRNHSYNKKILLGLIREVVEEMLHELE